MKKGIIDRISCILAGIASFVLLATAFLSAVWPDKDYSKTEKRNLVQFIQPSFHNVLDGSWEQTMESYSLDQFVLREFMSRKYFGFLDMAGVYERNNYVYGENDAILSVNDPKTELALQRGSEDLFKGGSDALRILKNACDQSGAHLISLQIPHKDEFFSDNYPRYYQDGKMNKTIYRTYFTQKVAEAGFDVLDVEDELFSRKNEYLYYYTDNHYTYRGAYYTYLRLLDFICTRYGENLFFPEWEACEYFKKDTRFVGGNLRVYGDSGRTSKDYLEYVIPYDLPSYCRMENGELSDLPLFDTSKSNYSLFMAGNKANTIVYTSRPELPSILFIGYSYTNPLETMAVYSFDEMHSLDPRYFEGSISQYIVEHKPDYVVAVRNDLRTNNKNILSSIE